MPVSGASPALQIAVAHSLADGGGPASSAWPICGVEVNVSAAAASARRGIAGLPRTLITGLCRTALSVEVLHKVVDPRTDQAAIAFGIDEGVG